MNKDARTKANSTRAANTAQSAKAAQSAKQAKSPKPVRSDKANVSARRTWIVLSGLAIGLAGTGAFLKVLAPPPLSPDLFATSEDTANPIFHTAIAVRPDRWHSIYVHQSLTSSGNVQSLAEDDNGIPDHFVIGNGNGLGDGALQPGSRWAEQSEAGQVNEVAIASDCISICVVGNFNHSHPTRAQQSRLIELISALQQKLSIPAENVVFGMGTAKQTAAGVGTQFPTAAVRSHLLQ